MSAKPSTHTVILCAVWKKHEIGLYELRVVTCRLGNLRDGGRKLRRVIDERSMLEDRAKLTVVS